MSSTPSRIATNTAANLAGSLAASAINLAIVPTYIRLLGMESLGLIGLNASIALIVGLADFGLAPTLAREMARSWADEGDIVQGRTMLQTLQLMYVPLAILLGLAVVLAAPAINAHWLNASGLASDTVTNAIRLIGVSSTCQLLASFYGSGLNGLQRQVVGNVISTASSLLQAVGAYVLVRHLHHGIVAFFVWQVVVLVCAAIATAFAFFSVVPGRGRGLGFQRAAWRDVRSFALGMSGISLLSIVVTQADKVFLSRSLALEEFGHYSLAAMIAVSLRKLFGPLFAASYPRFTELARQGDEVGLERTYRVVAQGMAVVVIPATLLLVVFPRAAVFTWTGNSVVAEAVAPIVSLLVAAAGLSGVTQTPYALQLAHGWTRLAVVTNIVAVAGFLPALVMLGTRYGALGAAASVLAVSVGYVLVHIPYMHRRLLRGGFKRWVLRDTLPVAAAATIPLAMFWPVIAHYDGHRFATAMALAVAFVVSLGAALLATRDLRSVLVNRLRA